MIYSIDIFTFLYYSVTVYTIFTLFKEIYVILCRYASWYFYLLHPSKCKELLLIFLERILKKVGGGGGGCKQVGCGENPI